MSIFQWSYRSPRPTTPGDLKLYATRSTDLQFWSLDDIIVSEVFDPIECVVYRSFRSARAIGSLPREFLRLEVHQQ